HHRRERFFYHSHHQFTQQKSTKPLKKKLIYKPSKRWGCDEIPMGFFAIITKYMITATTCISVQKSQKLNRKARKY
ncbi:MAG: hypothetical protein SOW13_09310, partial [Sodaliphilus sp.]|nr:hypothetical protein [Sodaliphilus sp.]